MAYAPAALTEFKNGNTPLTGTLAMGSLFEAEFDQIYGNWNHFFGVAGNTLTIDGLESRTGTVVKVLGGVKVTTATSGVGATDGFNVDMDGSNNARIWNYENTDLIFGTNNTGVFKITSGKILDFGTNVANYGKIIGIYHSGNVWSGIGMDSSSSGIRIFNSSNTIATDPIVSFGLISSADGTTYSEVMRLNASGYLGIGVLSPSNPLHVQSTTTPQLRIGYDAGSYATLGVVDGGNLTIQCGEATGLIYLNPGASNNYVSLISGATLTLFNSANDKSASLVHNGTNLSISTSAGNIVIANTTECTGANTGALQVSGGAAIAKNLAVSGNYNLPLKVTNNTVSTSSSTGCAILSGGLGVALSIYAGSGITAAGSLTATTGNIVATAGYMTASGNITTTGGKFLANGGGFRSIIEGIGDGSGWILECLDNDSVPTGNNILRLHYGAASPDNNTAEFLLCSDNAGNRLIVYSDGDVVNSDNSYGAISDIKLKENIIDTDSVLENLLKLKVRDFNFKIDSRDKIQTGLIAQEVEKYFPKFVKDAGDEKDSYKILAYSKFIPILIKAIQEQQEIIEKLKK